MLSDLRAAARAEQAEAEVKRLLGVLEWYANQFCEHSTNYEGCGKLTTAECAGCWARGILQGDKPND